MGIMDDFVHDTLKALMVAILSDEEENEEEWIKNALELCFERGVCLALLFPEPLFKEVEEEARKELAGDIYRRTVLKTLQRRKGKLPDKILDDLVEYMWREHEPIVPWMSMPDVERADWISGRRSAN